MREELLKPSLEGLLAQMTELQEVSSLLSGAHAELLNLQLEDQERRDLLQTLQELSSHWRSSGALIEQALAYWQWWGSLIAVDQNGYSTSGLPRELESAGKSVLRG